MRSVGSTLAFNRILNPHSTFDEAFKSRIHVALEYKRLTDEYRRLIWKTNMDKMVSDRIKVTETAREHVYADKDVLGLEWNGREIRNGDSPSPPSHCSGTPVHLKLSIGHAHSHRPLTLASSPPNRHVPC